MHSICVIDAPRLALHPLQVADAPFILELLNQPSFIQFIGDRKVRTTEQACRYIADGPARSYAENGYGLLAVRLKSDGKRIGLCGLVKRDYLPDPDIGFAFLPAYWSQGFAFEAANAVIEHASAALLLRRVLAIVQPDNAASIKLLHRLGFSGTRTIKASAAAEELLLLACQR